MELSKREAYLKIEQTSRSPNDLNIKNHSDISPYNHLKGDPHPLKDNLHHGGTPNVAVTTSQTIQLPAYMSNSTHENFSFEPFDGLTNQYKSASSVLQNFSTTRSFLENPSSKYFDHDTNSSSKYYEQDKYFSSTEFTTSMLTNKNSVATTNYQQFPNLQTNYNNGSANLINSKSSTVASVFQQFSPSFHSAMATSSYTTLGTNSYTSAFNPPYFNSKISAGDSLNNNYMYGANLFLGGSNKAYSNTQGSTHIYPPYANNSNLFSHHGSMLGNTLTQDVSNYSPSLLQSGASLIHTPHGNDTASPFSPAITIIGAENSQQSTQQFDSSRMHFENDSNFNIAYCDLNQQQSTAYNNNEKCIRRKRKLSANSKKNSKTKKTVNDDADHNLERIFIWDLDETIIILHSLVTGEYAAKFGKDAPSTAALGLRIEEIMYHLATSQLFYNDLEDCDQIHVDDVSGEDNGQDLNDYNFDNDGFSGSSSTNILQFPSGGRRGIDWMRKLAYRYKRVKEIYANYHNSIGELIGLNKQDQWIPLHMELEQLSGSWHALTHKSLNIINRRTNSLNILVSKSHIIQTLSKCMLFGLGNLFPIENIYSSAKVGKESCFQRVKARFGRKCTYVVMGSSREDEVASKQLGFPFWRISNHGDLLNLQHALDLGHL